MKNLLLFMFAMLSLTLTSCDWYADPIVLGTSEIERDEHGKYVCRVSSQATYVVDSLLTSKDGKKMYEVPVEGKDVTAFTFDEHDKIYFYRGFASSEEIKKTYFSGHSGSASINFTLIFIGVIILYGIATHMYVKASREEVIKADAGPDDEEIDEKDEKREKA